MNLNLTLHFRVTLMVLHLTLYWTKQFWFYIPTYTPTRHNITEGTTSTVAYVVLADCSVWLINVVYQIIVRRFDSVYLAPDMPP